VPLGRRLLDDAHRPSQPTARTQQDSRPRGAPTDPRGAHTLWGLLPPIARGGARRHRRGSHVAVAQDPAPGTASRWRGGQVPTPATRVPLRDVTRRGDGRGACVFCCFFLPHPAAPPALGGCWRESRAVCRHSASSPADPGASAAGPVTGRLVAGPVSPRSQASGGGGWRGVGRGDGLTPTCCSAGGNWCTTPGL